LRLRAFPTYKTPSSASKYRYTPGSGGSAATWASNCSEWLSDIQGTIVDNSNLLMLWDIFCKVIDNHGDIGVCWRLSAQLADRGHGVRLWVDDPSALAWMSPQGQPSVQVRPWNDQTAWPGPGDVVIEAFGCELPDEFQAALASKTRTAGRQPAWINLEYLTAEPFAERNHRLPSPVMAGPAAGLAKHFFYPGFTPDTGGLLREPDLLERQEKFDAAAWLLSRGVVRRPCAQVVSLFCYEPGPLGQLLLQLARGPQPSELLVTAGRAEAATRGAIRALDRLDPAWNAGGLLSFTALPLQSQRDYDHLLWSSDLNFVRGEDSLVRALWAGKPFVWQLYPQDDGAHHAKLAAFLAWLDAPHSWRQAHAAWNGAAADWPMPDFQGWSGPAKAAKERLLAQPDLAARLLQFVLESQETKKR
jgi:uncharacterized repeat protein (TIGR03837 family)